MKFGTFYFLVTVGAILINIAISSPKYEHMSDCTYYNGRYVTYYDDNVTFICAESANEANEANVFLKSNKVNCSNHLVESTLWAGTIDFSNCRFAEIKRNFFVEFPNLHTFIISNVELETLQLQIFHEARNVKYLKASTNRLKEIPSHVFVIASKLAYADFSNNTIARVDPLAFVGAIKLESLDLSQNFLKGFDKPLFKDLLSLKLLNVSHNKMNKFDANMLAPPNLIQLDLSNNNLTVIENNAFDKMTKLNVLNLSSNPIGDFKIDTFANLHDLEHLNLMRTNITSFRLGTFSHQHNLISLDLSYNNFKEFDSNLVMPKLHNLKSLYLNGNQLTELNGFGHALFPHLQTLDLSNNKLDCSYLQQFMISITWEKTQFPTDTQSMNQREISIRVNKCEVQTKIKNERTTSEDSWSETSCKVPKFNNDSFLIIILLTFICVVMLTYLIVFLAANRNRIFEGGKKSIESNSENGREARSARIVEYSYETLL